MRQNDRVAYPVSIHIPIHRNIVYNRRLAAVDLIHFMF